MDEHVPLAVTRGLRRRGVDVLTAQEANMLDQDDDVLLLFAISQERVMFTQDEGFLALHHNSLNTLASPTPLKEHPSATWCADSFSSTTFSPPKKCADTSNTFNPTIRADLERYKKARRLKKQTADG